jgi:hypothetical protein
MKRKSILLICAVAAIALLPGCAVSNHGVFPKLVWYWSTDAKLQRQYDAEAKSRQMAAESNYDPAVTAAALKH